MRTESRGFPTVSLVPTALALWCALVMAAWAAFQYRQLLVRRHMIAMPSSVIGDRSVEIAYVASVATLLACAALLWSLLILSKLRPLPRWSSDRYLLAIDALALFLLAAEILVVGSAWRGSYFRSFDIPGPETYYVPALLQLSATAIELFRLRRAPIS